MKIGNLRYDPNAQDGDGDGFVQDHSPWERPVFAGMIGDAIAGSRSATNTTNQTNSSIPDRPLVVDFPVPVMVADKLVTSSVDVSNLEDVDVVKKLISIFKGSDSSDFHGLNIATLPRIGIFPQHTLVTGMAIPGKHKQRSSAIASIMPIGDGGVLFIYHMPDELARSVLTIGSRKKTVLEKFRDTSTRSIPDIASRTAFNNLKIPGIKQGIEHLSRQIMSLNLPRHAIPVVVSFIDDQSRSNENNIATSIPFAKTLSIWDPPVDATLEHRVQTIAHEMAHLLSVIPPGYSSLAQNWREVIGQDELPLKFSRTKAFRDAVTKDFLRNQGRGNASWGISQNFINLITPERFHVTEYADNHDTEEGRHEEDFADSFGLFIFSELIGSLGVRKTDNKGQFSFSDIFPARDKFFRDLLGSFGISDIQAPSGSKSTTRPHHIIPRININQADFPDIKYGQWITKSPVIGSGRRSASELIPDDVFLKANDAMRLLRKYPSLQSRAIRWMSGDLKRFGIGEDMDKFGESLKGLDSVLDIAPEIGISTMYRAFDVDGLFEPLPRLRAGQTVVLRAAPATFNIGDALMSADRASKSIGLDGGRRILLAIPKNTRGVIHDDEDFDDMAWSKSPKEAIIRGRFVISSISKESRKNNFTILNLKTIDESQNGDGSFFYMSTDQAIKAGSTVTHDNPLMQGVISQLMVDDVDGGTSVATPDGKLGSTGKFLFEIQSKPKKLNKKTKKPLNAEQEKEQGTIVASYQINDFGDAISFGDRIGIAGSKSSTSKKYALSERFLDDEIFSRDLQELDERDKKARERMEAKFRELGFDYDTFVEHVMQIIRNRREQIGEKKFRREMKDAALWYPKVRRGLIQLTNELNSLESMRGRRKFAKEEIFAMIAALSPQERVATNVKRANIIASVVAKDEKFSITIPSSGLKNVNPDVEKWIRNKLATEFTPSSFIDTFKKDFNLSDEQTGKALEILARVHPTLFASKGVSGIPNVIKALMIAYRTDSIDNILGGMKVRSFYSNFVDPRGRHVTIDTWMYRAMVPEDMIFSYKGISGTIRQLETILGKQFSAQDLFQSGDVQTIKSVGVYPLFAQVVREIARQLSIEFEDMGGIDPATLQAFLWEIGRTTWKTSKPEKPTNWASVMQWFSIK